MKKVLLSFAVAAIAFGANAQSKSKSSDGTHFGIGVKAALPIGTFGDVYSIGIGGEVSAEHNFSESFAGIASVGYTTYTVKSAFKNFATSAGFIPINIGARYYPSQQFFVGAKLGYAVSAQSGGTGGFNYEPQIGFNSEHFQASVGYNGISANGGSLSAIAATFTYKF